MSDHFNWNKHDLCLKYINTELGNRYHKKLEERLDKTHEIFKQKKLIAEVSQDIYFQIENKIDDILKQAEDSIHFAIEVKLDDHDETKKKILRFINQNIAGQFYLTEEGGKRMTLLLKETDFNDWVSIQKFLSFINDDINDNPERSEKKVNNKQAFYDYLFSLNYIKSEFSLKMGTRALSELSAGERGMVLLVFYLALSKDEIPLIIDQPEDNLDNQSVYNKLVRCINEAKKRRQVIIVTHNPNIAMVCDAEQIICCSMNKNEGELEISYTSGAIENENIKQSIIDILEGTAPAFKLREKKYDLTAMNK